MTNNLLLPSKYKFIGWCILIPATVAGIALILSNFESFAIQANVFAFFDQDPLGSAASFSIVEKNVVPTVVGVLFLLGALLVSFSKEKIEDEFISGLRQSSLLWAVLVNYVLLILSFMFIYGMAFLNVMLYNIFTILIIFIVRFNYVLYKNANDTTSEKYNQSAASY